MNTPKFVILSVVALATLGSLMTPGAAAMSQGNLAIERDPITSQPGKRETMFATLKNAHPVDRYTISYIEERVPAGFHVEMGTVRPDVTSARVQPDGTTVLRWNLTSTTLTPGSSWGFSYVFSAPAEAGSFPFAVEVEYRDLVGTRYVNVISTNFRVAEPIPTMGEYAVIGALVVAGIVSYTSRRTPA